MILPLQIIPAQLARLREDASRAGVDPASLLLQRAGYTREADVFPTENPQDWQQKAERFRQWADSHARTGPGLSLQDMSRESIYGAHG